MYYFCVFQWWSQREPAVSSTISSPSVTTSVSSSRACGMIEGTGRHSLLNPSECVTNQPMVVVALWCFEWGRCWFLRWLILVVVSLIDVMMYVLQLREGVCQVCEPVDEWHDLPAWWISRCPQGELSCLLALHSVDSLGWDSLTLRHIAFREILYV